MFGSYREPYKQAFNFNPIAFVGAQVAGGGSGNEPVFNSDGSLAQNLAGTANPLNGFIQCGRAGGSFPLVPGSAFPTTTIGSSSNARGLNGHIFNPAPRIWVAFYPKGGGKMSHP